MAAPAKFLFDMDFGAPDKTRERPATAAEIAQKIAAAEARAYRDGYDAAQREAKAESDRRAALALEEIGIAIKGIASRFSGIETRMETEAVDVAVAVARKLCSALISSEPLGEITALVSDCFSHLVATPHLVVRINASLYETARERIERLAKQSGLDHHRIGTRVPFHYRRLDVVEPRDLAQLATSHGRYIIHAWELKSMSCSPLRR